MSNEHQLSSKLHAPGDTDDTRGHYRALFLTPPSAAIGRARATGALQRKAASTREPPGCGKPACQTLHEAYGLGALPDGVTSPDVVLGLCPTTSGAAMAAE